MNKRIHHEWVAMLASAHMLFLRNILIEYRTVLIRQASQSVLVVLTSKRKCAFPIFSATTVQAYIHEICAHIHWIVSGERKTVLRTTPMLWIEISLFSNAFSLRTINCHFTGKRYANAFDALCVRSFRLSSDSDANRNALPVISCRFFANIHLLKCKCREKHYGKKIQLFV